MAFDFKAKAKAAADKAQEFARESMDEAKRQSLGSLSREDFADFKYPKFIRLVDGTERRNIEVLGDEVAWAEVCGDTRILNLYVSELENHQLTFAPSPVCGALYFVDPNDEGRFVNLAFYLQTMVAEMIEELKAVSLRLGAKHASLQVFEEPLTLSDPKRIDVGELPATEEGFALGCSEVLFQIDAAEGVTPQEPALIKFAQCSEVTTMVQSVIKDSGAALLATYRARIGSFADYMMTAEQAAKIDAFLKEAGITGNFTFEGEILRESRRKLILELEY